MSYHSIFIKANDETSFNENEQFESLQCINI